MATTPAADLARLRVTYINWVFARDGAEFTAVHRRKRKLVLRAANPLALGDDVRRQEGILSGKHSNKGPRRPNGGSSGR